LFLVRFSPSFSWIHDLAHHELIPRCALPAAKTCRFRFYQERDEIRDRADVPFFCSCPGAAQHECCEPGPILLCMGRFRDLGPGHYGETIQLQPIMP
jgi:hypothetical protein